MTVYLASLVPQSNNLFQPPYWEGSLGDSLKVQDRRAMAVLSDLATVAHAKRSYSSRVQA